MIIYYGDTVKHMDPHMQTFDSFDPDPLYDHLKNKFKHEERERGPNDWASIISCPAFREHTKNMFCFRAYHDLKYRVEGNGFDVIPDQPDKIFIRSDDGKLISALFYDMLFIADSPVMMSQLPPYLENTEWSRSGRVIPGSFDIGRHARPIEVAVDLFSDEFRIKDSEVLFYLKFDTDQEIEFKKFFVNREILELYSSTGTKRMSTKKPLPLQGWYERNAKNKVFKRILQLAKENVVE